VTPPPEGRRPAYPGRVPSAAQQQAEAAGADEGDRSGVNGVHRDPGPGTVSLLELLLFDPRAGRIEDPPVRRTFDVRIGDCRAAAWFDADAARERV
jgi:hypothetical protein